MPFTKTASLFFRSLWSRKRAKIMIKHKNVGQIPSSSQLSIFKCSRSPRQQTFVLYALSVKCDLLLFNRINFPKLWANQHEERSTQEINFFTVKKTKVEGGTFFLNMYEKQFVAIIIVDMRNQTSTRQITLIYSLKLVWRNKIECGWC